MAKMGLGLRLGLGLGGWFSKKATGARRIKRNDLIGRRHPRIPCVYTCKDKEDLLKK